MTNVLVETANRTLKRKGYAAEEARMEMLEDDRARLTGSLLVRDEIDIPARLMRIVEMLPDRGEFLELRRGS